MFNKRKKDSFRNIDSFDDSLPPAPRRHRTYDTRNSIGMVGNEYDNNGNPVANLEIPETAYSIGQVSSVSQSTYLRNADNQQCSEPMGGMCFSQASGGEGVLGMSCGDTSPLDTTTDSIYREIRTSERDLRTYTMPRYNQAMKLFEEFDVESTGHDFSESPVNDSTVETSSHSSDEKRRARRKYKVLLLVSPFVIGVVLLTFGLLKRKQEKRSIRERQAVAAMPTAAPIVWAGQPDNIPIWLEALSDVSDPSSFSPGAAQTSALQWLSTADSRALDPGDSTSTELVERYIAAVLYFSTSGETWSSKYNFLSSDSICSWNDGGVNGIWCNDNNTVSQIFIVDNMLRGSIPSEVNYLQRLETLDLFYNQLSGSVPDMSSLSELRHIDADGNLLTGQVPNSLFNLPSLERLFLLNNFELTGTIPEITAPKSKLQRISLYNCNLNGQIPSSLAKATDLTFFQVFNNSITGTIPSELSNLPALELFSLRANDLTGSIPSFDAQTSLETISLGENRLKGTLPATIAYLSNLKLLYLQENDLTGTVPLSVGTMRSLEQIWLFGNAFDGALPTFFANSGSLQQVFLGDNHFSGGIDALLQQGPSSIQFLDLGGNQNLTGGVSSALSKFPSLVHFNVSYTGLTGAISETFANLNLNVLALEGTGLVGDLTKLLCGGGTILPPSLSTLTADCAGTSPNVQCACCTECL